MADELPAPVRDPAAAVYEWRLVELCRAGYMLGDAERLAHDMRVDLHLAVDLLQHGCPLSVALRILA